MTDEPEELKGNDLSKDGIAEAELGEGKMALGHANGEGVILVRDGGAVFAIRSVCSHYGGPLAEGLFDGEGIRCPWHHACFDLRTGAVSRPPAYKPVETYEVFLRDGRFFVGEKRPEAANTEPIPRAPASVVIVGAGAAGHMAAETLREEGYEGPITIVAADPAEPYDRPNVSKDYLAGNAPEDWMPLRDSEFYAAKKIDLILGQKVVALDARSREVTLVDGRKLQGGAILLATGADPVRLPTPGGDLPHVFYVRTLADSRAIIKAASGAKTAVVVGASFIGLEVAASLVARELEVHVVAPEPIPMERVLGAELGGFVRTLHEEHGVRFHLEQTVELIEKGSVTLKDGSKLSADLVVMGVGVRPSLELAEKAGLAVEKGVVVNEFLETSALGIWAAGDIARWPDPYSGESIRVEHWVVAQRQGQTAARNILGRKVPFDDVPFFWSQHYDVPINYVGHAEKWDRIDVSGSIADRDCVVAFRKDGKTLAVASIYRDLESLQAGLAMERRDEAKLKELVPGG